MKGSDIALATLMREAVDYPCINYSWMTSSLYMSKVTGRDYWSDREGVFFEGRISGSDRGKLLVAQRLGQNDPPYIA